MCARVSSRLQPASKASNIMRFDLKMHGAGVVSLQHDLATGCTIGFVLTHVVIHCGHRLTPCVPLVQAHLVDCGSWARHNTGPSASHRLFSGTSTGHV